MKIEEIKVSGGRNIRFLGQYKTSDNREINKTIIRSARLDKMSKKKRDSFFKKYNITTVIDFRNDIEIEEGKNVVFLDNVDHYHIPILSKAFFGISHEKKMSKATYNQCKENKDPLFIENYMVNMYKSIVFEEYSQKKFKEFFDCLLNKKEGTLLYHCTGGKDRTGITSVFILSILGVSKDDILDDYSASDIFNKRHNFILQTLMNLFLWLPKYRKLLSVMLYSKRYYMEETIKSIEEKYGSIVKYLEDVIGIDKSKQDLLKDMLLV